MLSALMLAATLNGTPSDPLASAIEHYRTVDNYRVTIHSSHDDGEEYIRNYYKKPGFVRMEFIRPHAGTILIYSPHTLSVRLWPFGVQHFPSLNLNRGNPLIKSSRSQHVDHSDVGTLFENVRTLRDGGSGDIQVIVGGVEVRRNTCNVSQSKQSRHLDSPPQTSARAENRTVAAIPLTVRSWHICALSYCSIKQLLAVQCSSKKMSALGNPGDCIPISHSQLPG